MAKAIVSSFDAVLDAEEDAKDCHGSVILS